MRTHEEQRAALLREREARKAAYLEAVAARDAIVPFASGADAMEFDRRELSRAEAKVGMALHSMRQWKDPVPNAAPEALAPQTIASTTPEAPFAPFPAASGVVDTVEAIAARILASAAMAEGRGPSSGTSPTVHHENHADAAAEALAQQIIAAAAAAEDEEVDAIARRIADA